MYLIYSSYNITVHYNKYDYHISMYIAHVHLGSGCNSYQGHVNDSGEFWIVLGCTRIRCH